MKTAKHFALVVLMVVGATLSASTPAWAWINLTPTGAEPGATGQASSSDVQFVSMGILDPTNGISYWGYSCTLYVTCQGLTPGATYMVPNAGTFKASRDGTGSLKKPAKGYPLMWAYTSDGVLYSRPGVGVSRINPDGSYTLVLWALPSSPSF
jgi:hypothetical protein